MKHKNSLRDTTGNTMDTLPLFSSNVHFVTVVTQALIIDIVDSVSTLYAIRFRIEWLYIFTQLEKEVGKCGH